MQPNPSDVGALLMASPSARPSKRKIFSKTLAESFGCRRGLDGFAISEKTRVACLFWERSEQNIWRGYATTKTLGTTLACGHASHISE